MDAQEAGISTPMSSAQQRLWFLHETSHDPSYYNVPVAWQIAGQLDVAAFSRALHHVAARHEALRTSFRRDRGRSIAVIRQEFTPQEILRCMGPTDDPGTHMAEALARPFDLANDSLVRLVVLQESVSSFKVLLVLHHIVCDYWSVDILTRELSLFYQREVAGELVTELSALPRQYSDYVLAKASPTALSREEEQLAYWDRQLKGAPAASGLRTNYERPLSRSYAGGQIRWEIAAGTVRELHTLARAERSTLFALVVTALGSTLWKRDGIVDLLVGAPVADRSDRDTNDVIGLMLNMVALRLRPSGKLSYRTFLRQVRGTIIDALERSDVPFDRVVRKLQPARQPGTNPLVQMTCQVLHGAPPPLQLAELTAEPLDVGVACTRFDLEVNVTVVDDAMVAQIIFATELFTLPTIEGLARDLERQLAFMAHDADMMMN